jgi:hypothetical protein
MTTDQSSEAYERSVALLRRAATPYGFVASVKDVTNYQRVWTRDGVITGLAALLSGEEALTNTFRDTLLTIFGHQHPTGFFPSNVDPQTGKASYGGNCGRVDNVSWAVIGLLGHARATGSSDLADRFAPHVQRALAVMDAWEFNGKGLVYVPQSGNWADEYVQHGYVLYDQLLRVWALEGAAHYYRRDDWRAKAAAIRQLIARNYWNGAAEPSQLYAPNLVHQLREAPGRFWLMGFNPARVYGQFDLAANALALLLDVGTGDQQSVLLDFLREELDARAFLLPAFAPAIEPEDFLMRELESNYAYEFRNLPHEFHNGGLWPVWNGLLAAALRHCGEAALADRLTGYLHEANRLNTGGETWGFYENFHGVTRAPIGVPYCTWSAAGAIIGGKGTGMVH